MGFGREVRGRGIRRRCRGKVCCSSYLRSNDHCGAKSMVLESQWTDEFSLIDPRKYKRRPGGAVRKVKASQSHGS